MFEGHYKWLSKFMGTQPEIKPNLRVCQQQGRLNNRALSVKLGFLYSHFYFLHADNSHSLPSLLSPAEAQQNQ